MKFLLFLFFPLWTYSQTFDVSSHKDYPTYQQIFKPLLADIDSLGSEIARVSEDEKEAVFNNYTNAITKLHDEVEEFVSAHTSSLVSLQVLTDTMKFSENIEEVERVFNFLSEEVKESPKGKELANYFSNALAGKIGRDAVDFTQPDMDGKPVSLSSFKGQYVLVDFWASWCKPCRKENPNVVKAYHRFKDRNFRVLGVSIDTHREQWVKAVQEDSLPWTNVCDLMQPNSAGKIYKVSAVPTNFLVDPMGKIVAKNLRGEELHQKLNELLGGK